MRSIVVSCCLLTLILASPLANAQGQVIRRPAQELIEALGKWAGKGGSSATRELAELGGEATMRRVGEKLLREGGEDAVQGAVRMIREVGPDVVRAIDNVPNPTRVLRAADELPVDQAAIAFRRLAAGSEGRALAETVERWGTAALRAEARHPGVGGGIVRHLGTEGAELAGRVNTPSAIQLARHTEDIARLPAPQREGVLALLYRDSERVIRWMGEFVQKNPGKVLFTAAASTVILANSESLLGGTSELAYDADGNPVIVPRIGAVERTVQSAISQILKWLLPVVAGGLAIWIGVKLWGTFRRQVRTAGS